jgi:hypothetical protein
MCKISQHQFEKCQKKLWKQLVKTFAIQHIHQNFKNFFPSRKSRTEPHRKNLIKGRVSKHLEIKR